MVRLNSMRSRAFSLAELLVVVGVITLLVALIVPPLMQARRQAMRAQCMGRLQQLGVALQASHSEYSFYPLWDDGREGVRHTWIDVLLQRRLISAFQVGYCPEDNRPDGLNQARGQALRVYYPGQRFSVGGIDYSYGIGVPLSAGGWKWQQGYSRGTGDRPRRFNDHTRDISRRVLAGDGNWSYIYNMSGAATRSGIWNDPTRHDNTVAWRHSDLSANLLMQDGHVDRVVYEWDKAEPVNTSKTFVWHSGEDIHVGPDSSYDGNWYPNEPPPNFGSAPAGEVYPNELNPGYYTTERRWTLIDHK
jgi:prepilin-type processing-associated H-X9-DG protein